LTHGTSASALRNRCIHRVSGAFTERGRRHIGWRRRRRSVGFGG
jgi:hypothetical protein